MPHTSSLCVAVLLAVAPPGLAQVHYELLPPDGAITIWPWAVSCDGRTVLGDAQSSKAGWSSTVGTLAITSTGHHRNWPQVGASRDLTRFAWAYKAHSNDGYRAYRQSASGFPELLEVPVGTSGDVRVFNMSSDGDFVAGFAEVPSALLPVIWDAAGIASIPYPSGVAVAVSDDGQTVLLESSVSGLWGGLHISPQAGVVSIGASLPPASNFHRVFDMSADGTWVIGQYSDAQGTHRFRWSLATGAELIEQPGRTLWLDSISDDGSTIVGQSHTGTGQPGQQGEAFFWTESTGVVPLRSFLMANGYPATPALFKMYAVSADGRSFAGTGADGAFVVSLGPTEREEVGRAYCGPAVPHSAGSSATCRLIGTPIVWANDLIVEANDMPPHRFGFFVTSDQMGFVAQPGASVGNLCLSGAIGRYSRSGEIQQSDASGTFSLSLDLPTTPTIGGTVPPILAGDTRFFQAWFRDATPAGSSNFTSGVAVTFR